MAHIYRFYKPGAGAFMALGLLALIAVPGIAASGAFAQPPATPKAARAAEIAPDGQRVVVAEAGLSVAAPPGYRFIARKELPASLQPAVFVFVGPTTGQVATNINLVVQNNQPPAKADTAAAEQLGDTLKKSEPVYKKDGTGTLTVGGEKAAYLLGTYAFPKAPMQNKQVLVIHNNKQYVFTFTCAASVFAKQVGAFDALLASLKWQ